MNVTLNEVVLTDQRGKHHLFENLIVHARKIRQIQLPSSNQVGFLDIIVSTHRFLSNRAISADFW